MLNSQENMSIGSESVASEKKSFWSILGEALKGSERDFTTGSIGQALFILSVPMIIEMMAESLFAIVDIFYVAHLGANAVSVVVITESMMFVVYSIAIGLSVGAMATVARRIGEKDPDGAAKAATHIVYLGIAVSILIGIVGVVFGPRILELMGAEPAAVTEGATFIQIMLGGSISVLFLFIFNSIFRGAGNATIAMWVLWLSNLLNIILGYIFIFVLHFGVTGAAIGTTIGRGVGAAVAAYSLFSGSQRFLVHRHHWKLDTGLIRKLIQIAWPAILQFSVQTLSFNGLVRIVAVFGSQALAGYGIAMRVVMFLLLPSVGLANAAATLVGQNLGAKRPNRGARSVWDAAYYNAVFQGVIGVLLVALAHPIATIFTAEPEVLTYATDGLRIVAYGFVFYAAGMVFEGSFNGAGDTWTPTVMNVFVFLLFEIPFAYWLAYQMNYGPNGVFWAITAAFSLLAVVSAVVFRQGRWKLKVV